MREYVTPAKFAEWQRVAQGMGFAYVASGPLVRSSYRAGEYFLEHMLRKKGAAKTNAKAPATAAASSASSSLPASELSTGHHKSSATIP